MTAVARCLGSRMAAVGVAVPGQVSGTRLLHASMLGWRDVELARIGSGAGVLVVAGNDATMAGIAEARTHPARPAVLLHVVAEVGLGGVLVVDGRPVRGARDLQGEFGHLPMGEPDLVCPCGARGCWGVPFATAGPDAVLTGVGLTALDQALDAARLAAWAGKR